MANVDIAPQSKPAPAMNRITRFSIGGLGGLLPVIATLITVDLTVFQALIDKQDFTAGMCAGYCIRVFSLVLLGGIVAALNSEVVNPLSLVQIGIAAPALVTSYLSAASLPPSQKDSSLEGIFFSSAYAAEEKRGQYEVAGGWLSDIAIGLNPSGGMALDRAGGFVKDAKPPEMVVPGTNLGVVSPATASFPKPVFTPPTPVPGTNLFNFIVVNTGQNSCLQQLVPESYYSQLKLMFPEPSYQVTTGYCQF
ncbi:hypothetical protein HFN78_35225 [Rhizobium laguerreae]|uniref:hypothetical protein n=1 Tax=Rhizobium laguerreae TaxID=1076926 RepID=UPI001C911529|nr:hypothetical protein [Rhizobium laguerreae]MBY3476086.1 hypothetical protein [Rhizobium laguerreae]MBY3521076.1 hypothetical protein [Rhizobium laguerreae]